MDFSNDKEKKDLESEVEYPIPSVEKKRKKKKKKKKSKMNSKSKSESEIEHLILFEEKKSKINSKSEPEVTYSSEEKKKKKKKKKKNSESELICDKQSENAEPINSMVVNSQGKNKGVARSRKATKLKQFKCPEPECGLLKTNLRKHFRSCHPEHSELRIAEILLDDKKNRRPKSIKKKRVYPRKLCVRCGKVVSRLDQHITKVHKVEKDSMDYKRIIGLSPLAALINRVEKHDYYGEDLGVFNSYMKAFESYLKSPNGGGYSAKSAVASVRKVISIVRYIIGEEKVFKPVMLVKLKEIGNSNNWIENFVKENTYSMCYNYILALKQFYVFVRAEISYLTGWATEISIQTFYDNAKNLQKYLVNKKRGLSEEDEEENDLDNPRNPMKFKSCSNKKHRL